MPSKKNITQKRSGRRPGTKNRSAEEMIAALQAQIARVQEREENKARRGMPVAQSFYLGLSALRRLMGETIEVKNRETGETVAQEVPVEIRKWAESVLPDAERLYKTL